MTKIAALISYLGSGYYGWQSQSDKISLQSVFEHALFQLTQEKIRVFASGRTDTGVNALGQVVHFQIPRFVSLPRLLMGMNAYLPSSLRVLDLKIVSDDFHAQRSATHKRYSYFFQTGPAALPSLHHRVFWIKKDQPDVTLMQKAAQDLIGLHDFKVFCATDSSVKTTTRKVLCAEVTQRVLFGQYRLIQVQITATGFLKQMMRRIAGTLLDIGLQKKSPSVILHLLKSSKETPDYASLGRTAPGYGLWLERVFYPSGNWSENLKDHRPENYKEEHKEELRQEQQELQRQEQRKNQSAELNFFEQEDMNFPYFF